MQSTMQSAAQSSGLRTAPEAGSSCRLALCPARRSAGRSARTRPVQAVAAMPLALAYDGDSSYQALSQMASGVGLAIGAAWVGWEMLRDQGESDSQHGRQECPTCGGTGMVECMCNRWSDGDKGCGACRGSGMMTCQACGGGGTAVPITAKLYKSQGQPPRQ